MGVEDIRIIPIAHFIDSRGELSVIEGLQTFNLSRVYWLSGSFPESIRGVHAHKKLNQLFLPMSGAFQISFNDGKLRKEILLDASLKLGLYVPAGIWREVKILLEKSILTVLADRDYDEEDYIYDFDSYMQWIKELA